VVYEVIRFLQSSALNSDLVVRATMMTHELSNMVLMKLRSKGLRHSITWIGNTWNVYNLEDAFIPPLLNGKVLDINMTQVRSWLVVIDHVHGCLVVNVE
jgi:hypothetical protein